MALFREHFIALESDPVVFNAWISLLGVSHTLQFQAVLSLVTLILSPVKSSP
jgi:hypothetical protein